MFIKQVSVEDDLLIVLLQNPCPQQLQIPIRGTGTSAPQATRKQDGESRSQVTIGFILILSMLVRSPETMWLCSGEAVSSVPGQWTKMRAPNTQINAERRGSQISSKQIYANPLHLLSSDKELSFLQRWWLQFLQHLTKDCFKGHVSAWSGEEVC